jgi:hypothetical protein
MVTNSINLIWINSIMTCQFSKVVKAGGLSVNTRALTFSTCQASPPDAYLRKGKRDIFVYDYPLQRQGP